MKFNACQWKHYDGLYLRMQIFCQDHGRRVELGDQISVLEKSGTFYLTSLDFLHCIISAKSVIDMAGTGYSPQASIYGLFTQYFILLSLTFYYCLEQRFSSHGYDSSVG